MRRLSWLSKGMGSTEALMARFAADFTMITRAVFVWIIRRSALFERSAGVAGAGYRG